MTRKKSALGLAPFDPAEHLADEASIAEFLNASFEMNDPAVSLNALNVIARARGMTELAKAAGVGRENLYNALKPGAKPRFETVVKLMDAMGLALHAEVKPAEAPKHTSTRRRKPETGRAVASAGKTRD
jgi:probable addiction module antidote protein